MLLNAKYFEKLRHEYLKWGSWNWGIFLFDPFSVWVPHLWNKDNLPPLNSQETSGDYLIYVYVASDIREHYIPVHVEISNFEGLPGFC